MKTPTKLLQYALALMMAASLVLVPRTGFGQEADESGANVAGMQKATPTDEPSTSETTDPESASDTEKPESDQNAEATSQSESQPGEIVSFGKDVHVKSNETAQAVVVIGGSATIDGNVEDAIVVIGGSVHLRGKAESVVAVLGNVDLLDGAAASESVAVMGRVKVAKGAETGEAVAVGGTVDVDKGGTVSGEKVSLGLPGLAAPEWLQAWFRECVLKLRPLAPQIGWLWAVVGVVLLFYFLIALLFKTPVSACTNEIINRPASSFFIGLLTKMLLPVLFLILGATGIGVFVIPFLLVALFVMGVFGKVALLEAIGISLGRAFGTEPLQKPLVAFLIGSVVVVLLYMIPVLGLIVFLLLGVWGLGGAVMAMASGIRRETPKKAAPSASPHWPNAPVSGFATPGSPSFASGATTADSSALGFASTPGLAADPLQQPSGASTSIPPGIPHGAQASTDPMTYPYASFWERVGAAFLDIILVSILGSFVGGPPWAFLVALAYFAGMWTWRGTTIGGIVLGLKVVRLDGQPVTFAPALVRGLAAAFSIVVLFLGFLWIAWDRDKQGWHDKIAGTVVIKLPRGTPLVCA